MKTIVTQIPSRKAFDRGWNTLEIGCQFFLRRDIDQLLALLDAAKQQANHHQHDGDFYQGKS